MNAVKAPRGRPKGTGINDQQRLADIARLMASDPHMKPTTAIKALGITDPSAIRRLRDKLNSAAETGKHKTNAALPPRATPGKVAALKFSEPVKRIEPERMPPPAAMPVAAAVTPPTPEPTPPASVTPPLSATPPAPPTQAPASERTAPAVAVAPSVPAAAVLLGHGLHAAITLFEQQMLMAQSLMRLPPIRDLLLQQIALTEFMLSVARRSPGSRGSR